MKNSDSFQAETHFSRSADETRAFGQTLAQRVRRGDLIFLHGELGAGKTTLVQGLTRGLKISGDVVSPTFVLIAEHIGGQNTVLHLDAYRLENLDEHALGDAGIFDFLARRDAVKIVEWPSRIAEFLPAPRFEIWLRQDETNEAHRVLDIRERRQFPAQSGTLSDF